MIQEKIKGLLDMKIQEVCRHQNYIIRKLLHVGCGMKSKSQTTRGFNSPDWKETRYDIDPSVNPDIKGSMIDMYKVKDSSFDAIYSSHNIEHLYPHEVNLAVTEFKRVLDTEGFVVLTCPDLQSVGALIADDRLEDVAYSSPAGPITPLDIVYGHRPSIEKGNHFMAHKCGFTQKTLRAAFKNAGFKSLASVRRGDPFFDLWVIASKSVRDRANLIALAQAHFPIESKSKNNGIK